jgi:hypothetical protein
MARPSSRKIQPLVMINFRSRGMGINSMAHLLDDVVHCGFADFLTAQ